MRSRGRMITYILLTAGAVILLFPFFWMIWSAFRPEGRALNIRINWSELNQELTADNFRRVFTQFNFIRYFINSLIVAGLSGLFATIFATLAAYAFAKKKFWGRDALFTFILAGMMIPGLMYMVPQYIIVFRLGGIEAFGIGEFLQRTQLMGIDTYGAMIVPHLANIFGLFLLRQFMITIPNSLVEAGKIDGASELQIIRNVVVPLSVPVIVTLFLLSFQFHWGNFLWQLIVVNKPELYTVPVGLALFRSQHEANFSLQMAGACISIIPIAIIFLFAQRYFIEGMTKGAVKG